MGLVRRGFEPPPSRYKRRSQRRSSSPDFLTQFVTFLKITVFVSLLFIIPALVFYLLPFVKFFWLEAAPRIFYFYYELLTPRNLFLLLNFIIVTILVTTKISRKAASSGKRAAGGKTLETAGSYEKAYTAVDTAVKPISVLPVGVAHVVDRSSEVTEEYDTLRAKTEDRDRITNAVFVSETTNSHAAGEVGNEGEAARSLAAGEGEQNGEARKEEVDAESRLDESIAVEDLELTLSEQRALPTIPHDRRLSHERFLRRKHAKPTTDQAKNLRISRPVRRGDTLEATWKAISEKRHPPLARHLRKVETMDTTTPANSLHDNSIVPADSIHKADTWELVATPIPPGTASADVKAHHHRIRRREPSISQEELNKKVESFIGKFNEQIRLQREQSLIRYREMVDRGS